MSGNKFEKIFNAFTHSQAKTPEVVKALEESGAQLPVEVWSAGFMDVLDGVPKGGIPEGHKSTYTDYESAASQYLFLKSFNVGESGSVVVTKPDRIVDSTGKQVYPKE